MVQLPALSLRGFDPANLLVGLRDREKRDDNALRRSVAEDKLKGNALNRALTKEKLGDFREKRQNRNALNALAPKILEGNEDAFTEAVSIDPTTATSLKKKFFDLQKSGTEAENKAFEREAQISFDLVESAKKSVADGEPEEAVWQGILQQAATIPNFDETKLPTDYQNALALGEAGRFSIGLVKKFGKPFAGRTAEGDDVLLRTDGRGGVENLTASTGFRPIPKDKKAPTQKKVFDNQTKTVRFATDAEIAANRDRLTPVLKEAGGLTTAQQTRNDTIAAAQERILAFESELRPGQNLEDLIRERTAKFTDTGGDNTQFDPLLARDVAQAIKRKQGGDRGIAAFRKRLKQRKPVPAEEPPPPEGPGIIERGVDLLSNLFANDGEALPSGNPETAGVAAQPGPAAPPTKVQSAIHLENARDAIRRGANRQQVEARLRELKIDPRLLDN